MGHNASGELYDASLRVRDLSTAQPPIANQKKGAPMLLGYCLDPVCHTWFPPVALTTPQECWRFCLRYHVSTPEIRITDLDDYLVLHVQDHVLRIPLDADQMGLIDLRDGGTTVVPATGG